MRIALGAVLPGARRWILLNGMYTRLVSVITGMERRIFATIVNPWITSSCCAHTWRNGMGRDAYAVEARINRTNAGGSIHPMAMHLVGIIRVASEM